MRILAERNTESSRERALAEQLDRAIDSLRQGDAVESRVLRVSEVAPLLEIAASLIERGRSRQRLLAAPVP